MTFLKIPDQQRRLHLQLKGFLTDTYLESAAEKLAVPMFRLPELEFDEQPTKPLIVNNNLRLGNRLERFFSFVIETSDKYDLLAENIQVISNKVTVGELDFILIDRQTNQTIHVELGGKLYLYKPSFDNKLMRWIGPNKKDSLFNKLTKLKTKQLPLLYNPQTIKLLAISGIDVSSVIQQVCFKARLFLPYLLRDSIPEFVQKKNIKGYYLNLNDFLSQASKADTYFLPEKQDWIVDPVYGEIWHTYDEIQTQIEQALLRKQSPMIWIKKQDGTYDTVFVTWW